MGTITFSDHVLRTMAKVTRMTKEEIAFYIDENKCVPVGGGCGKITSSLLLFSHKDNRHFVVSYRSSSKSILDIISADRYRDFKISAESLAEAERLACEEVHICEPGAACCDDGKSFSDIHVKCIIRNLKTERDHELYWKCNDPVLNALRHHFPDDDRVHKKVVTFINLNIQGNETCDATYYQMNRKFPWIAFTLRGL